MSADRPGPAEPADPAKPAKPGSPPRGDAARRLLARARRAKPAPTRRIRTSSPVDQPWSGAGPDRRDPTALGDAVHGLVTERSWTKSLTAAGILPRWEQIVGIDLAAHCRPEKLEGTALSLVAESTAWATQLRLMSSQVLAAIATEVGPGIVTRLQVRGPTAPDWRHGPLRVQGRGPRDTYG